MTTQVEKKGPCPPFFPERPLYLENILAILKTIYQCSILSKILMHHYHKEKVHNLKHVYNRQYFVVIAL